MVEIDVNEVMTLIEVSWESNCRQHNLRRAINVWYHHLCDHERVRIYDWMKRILEPKTEIQKRMMARFDPNNLWEIKARLGDVEQTGMCYFFEDRYWESENTYVPNEVIVEKKQIINKNR